MRYQSSFREDGVRQGLQKAQANDGQETTDVVNPLQDLDLRETIASSVSMWKVEEGKAEEGDGVVDE